MRLSTRTGLAAATAALLAVVLVSAAVVVQFQQILYQRVDQQLQDRAQTAPILAAVGDRLAVSELNTTIDGARVTTVDGTTAVGRLPASPLPSMTEPGWRTVSIDDEEWRVLTVVVTDVPLAGNRALVDLVAPLGDVNQQARRLRRRSFIVGLMAALVSGGVGLVLGRRAAAPLAALRRDAARIGSSPPGAWSVQPSYGAAEVDDVAGALNTSLDRLATETGRREAALEAARSFAAAASHELRTPLQGAMAELDLTLTTSPADSADASTTRSIRSARCQLDRMASALSAVRALTEVDLIEPSWFSVADLSELGDQAVGAISANELGSGTVTFEGDESAPCLVWSDGARLAIENVVRNALRHGRRPGSAAAVTLTVDAANRTVTIDDTGPGIPAHERARLLLAFERGATSESGSGLGLAFASGVASAHGGQLTIGDSPAGGARIVVSFGPPTVR